MRALLEGASRVEKALLLVLGIPKRLHIDLPPTSRFFRKPLTLHGRQNLLQAPRRSALQHLLFSRHACYEGS